MYNFKVTEKERIKDLLEDHYSTLLAIPDDFFELAIIDDSKYYSIENNEKSVGFFSFNEDGQLVQFYVKRDIVKNTESIIKRIIDEFECSIAMVPTYDLIYLNSLSSVKKAKRIHDHLYELNTDKFFPIERDDIVARIATMDDLDAVIELETKSLINPSKQWLYFYCTAVIENKGLYLFYKDDVCVGIGENRTWFKEDCSYLGVIVLPEYRSQGIGRYIISYLIELGLKENRNILASVEASNESSNKMLNRLGFEDNFQILKVRLV